MTASVAALECGDLSDLSPLSWVSRRNSKARAARLEFRL